MFNKVVIAQAKLPGSVVEIVKSDSGPNMYNVFNKQLTKKDVLKDLTTEEVIGYLADLLSIVTANHEKNQITTRILSQFLPMFEDEVNWRNVTASVGEWTVCYSVEADYAFHPTNNKDDVMVFKTLEELVEAIYQKEKQ